MMYLISYDIEDNYLRTKIAKQLIQHGLYRVQYSVFMGTVSSVHMRRLKALLAQHSMRSEWTAEDSIMIIPLHQHSKDNIVFLGPKPSRWDEMSGELLTLIF